MEVGKLGFSDMLRLPAYKNEKFFFRRIRGKMNMNHEHGDNILPKENWYCFLLVIWVGGWRFTFIPRNKPLPKRKFGEGRSFPNPNQSKSYYVRKLWTFQFQLKSTWKSLKNDEHLHNSQRKPGIFFERQDSQWLDCSTLRNGTWWPQMTEGTTTQPKDQLLGIFISLSEGKSSAQSINSFVSAMSLLGGCFNMF